MKRDWNTQHMFDHELDGSATGKTMEALDTSRKRTREIMQQFDGVLPQSIMVADKESRGDADLATNSYDETRPYSGAFSQSSSGARYGALSKFPQNILKACVLLYTKPGDFIFDPFAGHNSRMETCVRLGRHYIGCDICKRFMEFNRERAAILKQECPEIETHLHELNSTHIREHFSRHGNQYDFTITSPPYWCIEDYGPEYQQLGKIESYFEFMRSLTKVAEGNFHVLRKGAYCCWFINDFRIDGRFYSYHADVQRMLRDVGFQLHDIMIVDFVGSFGACFPNQVVDRKILPKRHEYGIVMRK